MTFLQKVLRLRGVTWEWNEAARAKGMHPGTTDAGVLAQELEAVMPELVTTEPDDTKRVHYTALVAVLIEALKELAAEHDALKKRVGELERAT